MGTKLLTIDTVIIIEISLNNSLTKYYQENIDMIENFETSKLTAILDFLLIILQYNFIKFQKIFL